MSRLLVGKKPPLNIRYFGILLVFSVIYLIRAKVFLTLSSGNLGLLDLPFADDFNHYYASARLVLDQLPTYCTDFSALGSAVANFKFHPQVHHSTNPPLLVVLIAPFAMLPPIFGWALWLFALVASTYFSLHILAQDILSRTTTRLGITLATAAILISPPFLNALRYAQVQPLILLLFLLGWRELRRNRGFLAGILWTVATMLKIFPWPLLIFLVLIKRKSAAAGIALSLLTGGSVCWFIDRQMFSGFLSCAVPSVSSWANMSAFNIGLSGTIHRFLFLIKGSTVASNSFEYSIIFFLLPTFIALTSSIFLAARFTRTNQLDLSCATLILISALTNPVCWPHYLVCALPLTAILSKNYSHRSATLVPPMLFYSLPLWPIYSLTAAARPLFVFETILPLFALAALLVLPFLTTPKQAL